MKLDTNQFLNEVTLIGVPDSSKSSEEQINEAISHVLQAIYHVTQRVASRAQALQWLNEERRNQNGSAAADWSTQEGNFHQEDRRLNSDIRILREAINGLVLLAPEFPELFKNSETALSQERILDITVCTSWKTQLLLYRDAMNE
ncbi:MAG: hypothetical protein WCG83_05815 [Candidatus Peregrinibacteria bacterium]